MCCSGLLFITVAEIFSKLCSSSNLLLKPPSFSSPFTAGVRTASQSEAFSCYSCSLYPLFSRVISPNKSIAILNPPWHLLLGRLEVTHSLQGLLWRLNEIIHVRCLAWYWFIVKFIETWLLKCWEQSWRNHATWF